MIVLDRYVVSLVPLSDNLQLTAGGNGNKVLAAVPAGEMWEVERLAVDGAGAAAIISIYAAIQTISTLREAGTGNRMVADESSPIRFYGTENIVFVINSGSASAQVGINAQVVSVVYVPRDIDLNPKDAAMSRHTGARDAGQAGGTPVPLDTWN